MTRWKNPLVWFRGLLAGFIGGGAGAVSSAVIAIGKTPKEYNLDDGLGNVLFLMFGSFVVSGALNAFAYLQKSPLPELEEFETAPPFKPERQAHREDIGLNNPPKE